MTSYSFSFQVDRYSKSSSNSSAIERQTTMKYLRIMCKNSKNPEKQVSYVIISRLIWFREALSKCASAESVSDVSFPTHNGQYAVLIMLFSNTAGGIRRPFRNPRGELLLLHHVAGSCFFDAFPFR